VTDSRDPETVFLPDTGVAPLPKNAHVTTYAPLFRRSRALVSNKILVSGWTPDKPAVPRVSGPVTKPRWPRPARQGGAKMNKITPFLWFNDQAEEAAKFYTSIFKNSRIGKITRYGKSGPGPAGSVMTVAFELDGQEFVALNGGPLFKFNEAISFVVNCETQAELDDYWSKLTAGGAEVQCGWLKDKYGVSWQIVPTVLPELLSDPDPVKAQRVMAAMLQMKKIDIDSLRRAQEQK
jgi:predicted 3-demethylubiquinone-9 3-methyltransferase (glyoxalase superfamily)